MPPSYTVIKAINYNHLILNLKFTFSLFIGRDANGSVQAHNIEKINFMFSTYNVYPHTELECVWCGWKKLSPCCFREREL